MKNNYVIDGRICWIELTQGQFCQIDVNDMELVGEYRWCASRRYGEDSFNVYANCRTGGKKRMISIHRHIMNYPKGLEVDHIYHNPLDNRRDQLRIVTHRENHLNRRAYVNAASKYIGVTWCNRDRRWKCKLKYKGKTLWLGRHDTEIEAAIAYANKHIELYGAEANPSLTNFLKEHAR